ncbi:MAG: dihydrodipicolinate synthase family protein [Thermoplasmata archaeon]|nr:dihydrodipicolinate synthase family protein [Candidatus Sysuiplasma acidicola]
MKLKIEGIWSPMPTPLDRQGNIDKKKIRVLVNHLIGGGVDGLFPLGTTGEFAMLDRAERRLVLQEVVDATNGRVPVLAGVSDPSMENIVEFGTDALDIGVNGIVATPPYYYSLGSEGIYNHYKMIHDSVDLPLLVYNIPEWTHNPVSADAVRRLAEDNLIVGMKYTENNLFKLLKYIEVVGKRIAVFTGSDAMALTCLEFGGRGAVVSMSNVWPEKAASIFDLFKSGRVDKARRAQKDLLPVIEAVGIGHFPAGLKEAMSATGMDVGQVKKPLESLTKIEKQQVRTLLAEAGMKVSRL